MPGASRIGTERESSLHAELKALYAGNGGQQEAARGDWVCDAVREDGSVVEVQTGSFAPLKKKIDSLSRQGPVLVVYPISVERHIELLNLDGTLRHRRKSPLRHTAWELFSALVYAPTLPLLPNLSIELVMVADTEVRIDDGRGSWRRKGVSKKDRLLTEIRGKETLRGPGDYRRFIPAALAEPFSAAELAKAAKIRAQLARRVVYVLVKSGIINEQGKRGRARVYVRNWTAELHA